MRSQKRRQVKPVLLPKIIYQDPFLLAVDKPPGWITNSSQTTRNIITLQDWLKEHFSYPLARSAEYRSGIVHRLDKDTSGMLLVAKLPETFTALQQQFKHRQIQKEYLALIHGKIDPKVGTISLPMGRLPWNRKRFGVLPSGRESITLYTRRNIYLKDKEYFSLVILRPKTGRTHQLRVHMKYLSNPIVSDPFYAGRKTSRHDLLWCPRLFLHASGIKFTHPEDNQTKALNSPLPADLSRVLASLEKVES